jgi:hypothetical protein
LAGHERQLRHADAGDHAGGGPPRRRLRDRPLRQDPHGRPQGARLRVHLQHLEQRLRVQDRHRGRGPRGRPFFACIWFLAQHDPHSCIEPHLGRCGGNARLAELNFIDDQVGRLKRLLADLGAAENTILLYTGDNGMGGEPFVGGKRTLDEGGFLVPGLLDWPAKFTEGRKIDAAASGMDMFPTLLEYLDLTSPDPKRPLDGVSLVPLIARERPPTSPPRTPTWSSGWRRSASHGGSRSRRRSPGPTIR